MSTRQIIKSLISGLFLFSMIAGCSDVSDVSVVKNGTLSFDKSITVGDAFDKYSYFTSTSWEDFETSNGRKIVEVIGIFTDEYLKIMKVEQKIKKASSIVQFKINKDDTFEIAATGFEAIGKNGKTKKIDAGKIMSNAQFDLMFRELYDDKPMSCNAMGWLARMLLH